MRHSFLVFSCVFLIAFIGAQERLADFSIEGQASQVMRAEGFVASHSYLPLNSVVKVSNPQNGSEIDVVITGRIDYSAGRIIDLSYDAAAALDLKAGGNIILTVKAPLSSSAAQSIIDLPLSSAAIQPVSGRSYAIEDFDNRLNVRAGFALPETEEIIEITEISQLPLDDEIIKISQIPPEEALIEISRIPPEKEADSPIDIESKVSFEPQPRSLNGAVSVVRSSPAIERLSYDELHENEDNLFFEDIIEISVESAPPYIEQAETVSLYVPEPQYGLNGVETAARLSPIAELPDYNFAESAEFSIVEFSVYEQEILNYFINFLGARPDFREFASVPDSQTVSFLENVTLTGSEALEIIALLIAMTVDILENRDTSEIMEAP